MGSHAVRGGGPLAVLALLGLLLPALVAHGAATSRARSAEPAHARAAATALPPGSAAERPNIVLIVTDDMRADDLAFMPNVRALLADQGAVFSNFVVTTPLCCPSRASILRGQYAHNHGVLRNTGQDGGFPTFRRLGRERSTVATWLQAGGYRTALFGKYLNGYPRGADPAAIPRGWGEWYAGIGHEAYAGFDYELNENGELVSYGSRPEDYLTDVLAAKATAFVERRAGTKRPFFAYLAPYAPHDPSTPAPRHARALADATVPRPPSFDEADVSDKPAWLRDLPAMGAKQASRIDEGYGQRLRSLLAVDEMVADLVGALEATGQLDDTHILFTSDNGYHLGEHRLPHGKGTPYEESIRVPLLVRGPGVAAGRVVEDLALNLDLAPTIAELAGVPPPDFIDGRSLVPALRGEEPAGRREAALVELVGTETGHPDLGTPASDQVTAEEPDEEGERGPRVPPYGALRTADLLYVEHDDGERELYDLRADPYQLDNLAATADPALLAGLAARLAELKECVGAGCRAAEDAPLDLPSGG